MEIYKIFPKSYLQMVNKSAQAVRQKYVSSSFIFTMCLNSYYILGEVFLNITDEIFSNFLSFCPSVVDQSMSKQLTTEGLTDPRPRQRERGRELDLIFFLI